MNKRFRSWAKTLSTCLILGFPSAAAAQVEKSNIVIGYGSLSGGFGAFWVAKEKGYFKERGLEVELVYTRTTTGLQVLNSGRVDMLGTGCAEFFEATRQGFENRVIASLFEYNLYLIASRKEITDPKLLIGKTAAVNRLGDTGHLSFRFALRRLGINPDSVSYVQIGSTPERFSALTSGAVAAAVQNGSLKSLVLKNGLNVLIDLQDPSIPSCLGGIAVSADTIKTKPKTVEAALRAIVKGNAYLHAGPHEETKQIFSKYMKLPADDKRLLDSWEYFAITAHSRRPIMTVASAKNVLGMMAENDPIWLKEDPARFLDLSIMEKIKKEGYLDAVYEEIKKGPKK